MYITEVVFFKVLRSPGIDSKESISPATVRRTGRYENPISI